MSHVAFTRAAHSSHVGSRFGGHPMNMLVGSYSQNWHGPKDSEPGAPHNEGRAGLGNNSGVWLAALMCELGRSVSDECSP